MTAATLPDLYATLGVARDAGEIEIRGAYGRAVLAAREPRRAQPSRELLDFALKTLTDLELRGRYDAQAPIPARREARRSDGADRSLQETDGREALELGSPARIGVTRA
jgi:curved DNA-binding protein CbpA